MITLGTVKIMLQTAGISRLNIHFDNEQKLINVQYVFRGVPGTKQITYQEIIDNLTIGSSEAIEGTTEAPVGPAAAITQELT